MIELQGTGVSAGIASGPLCFFRRAPSSAPREASGSPKKELERYGKAVEEAKRQLEELTEKARSEAGDEAASLFETHQLMLEDLDYVDAITHAIEEDRLSAEAAVEDAGKQFAEMFEAMDDEYMKARSADVKDISARLVRILMGSAGVGLPGTEPVIAAADDLTPSETIQLDKRRLLGFVLSAGNSNSHTAILARTLGIPAVIGVSDLKPEYEGRFTMIDGKTGRAVIDPDEAVRAFLGEKQRQEQAQRRMLEKMKNCEDVTLDGQRVRLYANITNPSDVDAVLSSGAQGIGLFRSEFLYLENTDFPTEEQQTEAYKAVLQHMEGKPVIIRTLDIGADKQVPYFNMTPEKNPAMGMRAIRICLTRPEIFRTQLRALYRASVSGKLMIMFPMIASVWEVQEVKHVCEEVRKELATEGVPFDSKVPLGVMIETPASVVISDLLAKEVDFFSIGTNDLTQYTLAVDRQGVKGMERFADTHHPAVLRMIRTTVENAHKAGIWAGICGESAADPLLLETFLAIGVDELSVSPHSVLPLRSAIRNVDTRKNRDAILEKL